MLIDDGLVVVEPVFLVPKTVTAEGIDRIRDLDEVLEELRSDVLVGGPRMASSMDIESMSRQ